MIVLLLFNLGSVQCTELWSYVMISGVTNISLLFILLLRPSTPSVPHLFSLHQYNTLCSTSVDPSLYVVLSSPVHLQFHVCWHLSLCPSLSSLVQHPQFHVCWPPSVPRLLTPLSVLLYLHQYNTLSSASVDPSLCVVLSSLEQHLQFHVCWPLCVVLPSPVQHPQFRVCWPLSLSFCLPTSTIPSVQRPLTPLRVLFCLYQCNTFSSTSVDPYVLFSLHQYNTLSSASVDPYVLFSLHQYNTLSPTSVDPSLCPSLSSPVQHPQFHVCWPLSLPFSLSASTTKRATTRSAWRRPTPSGPCPPGCAPRWWWTPPTTRPPTALLLWCVWPRPTATPRCPSQPSTSGHWRPGWGWGPRPTARRTSQPWTTRGRY